MKKLLLLLVVSLPFAAFAQNCSPFMGIGAVQFTDNLGNPLTNGALYVYQASTSTQAPSYSDSGCTQLNTNPVTFTTGGRAQIWINTGSFFKYVLCQVSTDGPACSGSDQLFSIDNVPGGATGGGGGGAPFISTSANPATTGVLRCASGDQCLSFRNQANSANLTLTKDSHDLLSWAGGSIKFPTVGAPTGVSGFDILWADSTANRWMMANNGGSAVQVVASGNDISTSDAVTQVHFGSTAAPLSGTPPNAGQFLQFNGSSNIVGAAAATESTFGWTNQTTTLTSVNCVTNPGQSFCAQTVFANAHTLTRLTYSIGAGPSGCATNAVISVRDVTSSTNLATSTVSGATGAFVDSGALSVAMTAGHTFLIGVTTVASGCGTSPIVNTATMVFQ